ncbi:MAG TPA: hypothetical protein PKL77_00725 [Candidatus Omnitrophota bacterium]|nr:hypothetical protein [Candidatus Omnitrophota bacterium]HPT06553.1 hypothetical protein [Candidatus Omnitrophota bacterium]
MHKSIFSVLCLVFSLAGGVFAQETLTITTYYPSPSGSYRELATHQLKVGRNYSTAAVADDTAIIEGNVGVGTQNIQQPAPNGQVKGNADVNDLYLRSINRWASQVTSPTMGTTNRIAQEWGPSGWLPTTTNIGAHRACFAYIYEYTHWLGGSGGRYNDMACRYVPATGDIEGRVGGGYLTCGWVCFD